MDWEGKLRLELSDRATRWASSQSVPCYKSLGQTPTVLFPTAADKSRNGNFHPDSWRAIASNASWSRRCEKKHSQKRALPPEWADTARELESSNSSDALLMNCFCFPGSASRIMRGLGLVERADEASEGPEFGFKSKLPMAHNREDTTELDMKIGSCIFEAKLTENDFTSKSREHVRQYRDLEAKFDTVLLPSTDSLFKGYQLIRNVLAAVHLNVSLIVLIDQRRPDLLQEWWTIHSAIKIAELRQRCGFRSWQQVAAASPPVLASFLAEKYGL